MFRKNKSILLKKSQILSDHDNLGDLKTHHLSQSNMNKHISRKPPMHKKQIETGEKMNAELASKALIDSDKMSLNKKTRKFSSKYFKILFTVSRINQ